MRHPDLSIVCWLYGDKYGSEHVNKLYSMCSRHIALPFRFFCLTDRDDTFSSGIIKKPIFDEFLVYRKNFRRLALLNAWNAHSLGKRILQLDLDMVITGDITGLIDISDPVKIWKCPSKHHRGYVLNPSLMLFDYDAMDHVYHSFRDNPKEEISRSRWPGTDQSIIANHMTFECSTWNEDDGVFSYRDDKRLHRILPDNSKIVGFYGSHDPKTAMAPWISEHWR